MYFRTAPFTALIGVFLLSSVSAQSPSTTRVSLGWLNNEATFPCQAPSTSGDGRYVVFQSADTNLVPGDANGAMDVFLRDTVLDSIRRVSVTSGGIEGNAASSNPSISENGRYIAFHSAATNLVVGDTNGYTDVFVYDRTLFTTIRVSLTQLGGQTMGGDSVGGVISADGNFVGFRSWATNIPSNPDTNGVSDIFRWDRTLGTVRRISVAENGDEPNKESIGAAISGTGRHVVFCTKADNMLPPGVDTNNAYDVFLRDVFLSTTVLISKSSSGLLGNMDSSQASVSEDGHYVAFQSSATNLVASDTNGSADIFRHDTQTGVTIRLSVHSNGSQANGASAAPAISFDGRIIAFESSASNLVSGDTNSDKDVFIRDALIGQTSRVSVSTGGAQADRASVDPFISGDSRFIVFESAATNLVSGDTNLAADIFKRDRGPLGVVLTKSGTCPGSMTITATGATPSRLVAVVYGSPGSFTLTIPPCSGLVLGISNPTLGALISANASGEAALTFNARGGTCGKTVQVVDVTTCDKSNTITL